MCLLAICTSSLEKCPVMSSALFAFFFGGGVDAGCPFLIGLFGFGVLSLKSSLCIFHTNSLSDISFANIFSHSIGHLLVLSIVPFAVQKLSNPNSLFLLLFPLPQETYLEGSCYGQYQKGTCLCSPLGFLWFQVSHIGL